MDSIDFTVFALAWGGLCFVMGALLNENLRARDTERGRYAELNDLWRRSAEVVEKAAIQRAIKERTDGESSNP